MNDDIKAANERALATVRESEALIEKAMETLARHDRMLEDAGIDPGKYRVWAERQMTVEIKARAREEFEAEMTQLAHDVEDEARRLGITKKSSPAVSPARRMRRQSV